MSWVAEMSGNLLQFVAQFRRGAPDLKSVQFAAPERQGQKGNVIDGSRLDQRLRGARRNQVEIGEHLLVQPDDAFFFILAHIKANDRDAGSRAGSRIDVFDAGDLPEQALHGLRDACFHFFGRCAGKRDHHVDHGNDDLRLFFSREQQHGRDSKRDGSHEKQRGELGIDEGVRQSACNLWFAHGRISLTSPSPEFHR